MTPEAFVHKWRSASLKERSAAQEHFIDLCRLLGEPTPAEADPIGGWYCFERGAKKTGGGDGWADVWKKGCFGWEYKGKGKDLGAALKQLQLYALALESPPLLIVSDIETIVIHTAFTNAVPEKHVLTLEDLALPERRRLLKWAFTEPERLKPGRTVGELTEQAAGRFASLAKTLRERGHEAHKVAHFLNKLLFCLFAEDVDLLPRQLVTRLLENGLKAPAHLQSLLQGLFSAMVSGGPFGVEIIDWFNGGLFDDSETLPLEKAEIQALLEVSRLDWSAIEPAIFGTLFERGLDPGKRSQLGAHYTDRGSIMRLIDPVIREPLLAEWEAIKAHIQKLLSDAASKMDKATALAESGVMTQTTKKTAGNAITQAKKAVTEAQSRSATLHKDFLERLRNFRVLDPACGSGNFLYLALQTLKDLEHQVILEAEALGLPRQMPSVGPETVHGIELNPYAAELARVTVWIGEIQWMLKHGYNLSKNPILRPLDTIEQRDAVMNPDGTEAEWPEVDVIVGNPPFLGDKKMLGELGEEYTQRLRALYKGRVPGGADLVTYWFEKARARIEAGKAKRAGLVATNSIRGGANRKVLERICEGGRIFNAWSDEPWINEGAAVRVSLVCFASALELSDSRREIKNDGAVLDKRSVTKIHADLTAGYDGLSLDLTQAGRLRQNLGTCFVGGMKKGAFDVPGELARSWFGLPNPHGRKNTEILKPWFNGLDVTRRFSDTWIIDFPLDMLETEAALFEAPFTHVLKAVKPARDSSNNPLERKRWWVHARTAPDLRATLTRVSRCIATPRVAKHRLFVFLPTNIVLDGQLVVTARTDNTTFGVLHSRFHELWALRMCTWLGVGNDPRYTPTTTFETFPFPESVLTDPAPDSRFPAIAAAAQHLNELRENWLNPPEWVERVPEIVPGYPDRLISRPEHAAELKKRTLTNLYNQRPSWLDNAHKALDKAVAAAYGWTDYTEAMPNEEILRRLLALNLERSSGLESAVQREESAVGLTRSQQRVRWR